MSNYRVSVSYNRVKSSCAYVVETEGVTKVVQISPKINPSVKKGILEILTVALRETKPLVSHEDIVFIEIPNKHLCEWLSGLVEYKDYSTEMDEVFDVLETMDCKYRFLFVKEPYAKKVMQKGGLDCGIRNTCSSLADVLKEFEE